MRDLTATDRMKEIWSDQSQQITQSQQLYHLLSDSFPIFIFTLAGVSASIRCVSHVKERLTPQILHLYLVSSGYQSWSRSEEIFVVLILFPVAQLQPLKSGRTLHSSPSRHGSIWHHHFCWTIDASTQEGDALVVPATWPGKHEHLTVCERSSILFLLQHRCNATTSHLPVRTWWSRCSSDWTEDPKRVKPNDTRSSSVCIWAIWRWLLHILINPSDQSALGPTFSSACRVCDANAS